MKRGISALVVAWFLVLGALPPGQCSLLFITDTCCENGAGAATDCCHASSDERLNENRRTLRFLDPRPCCPVVPAHALENAPVSSATTVAVQLESADAVPLEVPEYTGVAPLEVHAAAPAISEHPPDTPLFILSRTLLI